VTGPGLALAAAALFGLSAPAAKVLLGSVDPWLLAGLLYLGSGLGLGLARLAWTAVAPARREAPIARPDAAWLAAAIVAGGVVGPVLLMFGLASGPATQSALLLNLESPFTALLAWFVFREHVDARIAAGMAAITAGALALAWRPSAPLAVDGSALLIGAACLAWAIDNNLTRRVSGGDVMQIAALKGLVAGAINVVLALGRGAAWPAPAVVVGAAVVGLVGYGTSLALFVGALRHLGAGRTGAYFSTAPFVGAVGGVLVLGEAVTTPLLAGATLMAAGVWLHLAERHEHEHEHEHTALEHDHLHRHDAHHQHDHGPGVPAGEPHSHPHAHATLRHRHPHYPDLHHRHGH
jgi:drug/metabolite transporter (DMT)-like permease